MRSQPADTAWTRLFFLSTALICLAALPGCQSNRPTSAPGYDTPDKEPWRDTEAARGENARAVEFMAKRDWKAAEDALKAALAADVMFGPAHNNLGKVCYHQRRFYEAAREFQFAMKLMPNQPEPPNNLGLVFEAAGRNWLDDAVESYGKAMQLEPDNAQFIGNSARARVRRGDADQEVRDLLAKLVLRETRPDWAAWARGELSRLSSREEPDADAPAAGD